jgi:hypothetical protein
MGNYVKRLNKKLLRAINSKFGILILSITLIFLDLTVLAALYFQTLSENLPQDIFLLTTACSLTIPLSILLASQFNKFRSSVGAISNINRNGWKDPVLEKLVPSTIAMPEM